MGKVACAFNIKKSNKLVQIYEITQSGYSKCSIERKLVREKRRVKINFFSQHFSISKLNQLLKSKTLYVYGNVKLATPFTNFIWAILFLVWIKKKKRYLFILRLHGGYLQISISVQFRDIKRFIHLYLNICLKTCANNSFRNLYERQTQIFGKFLCWIFFSILFLIWSI